MMDGLSLKKYQRKEFQCLFRTHFDVSSDLSGVLICTKTSHDYKVYFPKPHEAQQPVSRMRSTILP